MSNEKDNLAFVHDTCIIDECVTIGKGTKIWHWTHISEEAIIGNNTSIGQNCFVDKGVLIGSNCKIQNGVSVYRGVTLSDGVFVGPNATFTNCTFPKALRQKGDVFKEETTDVMPNASIGANATILPGVKIGFRAMIGAGSVVVKDVPDDDIVVGNPARSIKKKK